MHIIIGCDHAGFDLKETCRNHLEQNDHRVNYVGVFSRDSSDYPLIAHKVARGVSRGEAPFGILVCGSGLGMSMAANRHENVRAALCHNLFSATMSRRHNDANILALGGRITGVDLALAIVDAFLSTSFEGGRHSRRVRLIELSPESQEPES
jgi:ribose 5-phosphate isomerase B